MGEHSVFVGIDVAKRRNAMRWRMMSAAVRCGISARSMPRPLRRGGVFEPSRMGESRTAGGEPLTDAWWQAQTAGERLRRYWV